MYIQNATKHCYFNSQPHEEADYTSAVWMMKPSYFNSQPHEEADLSAYNTLIQGCISTHSLTKRLTEDHDGITGAEIISTHSLTKRLTPFMYMVFIDVKSFQLTASRRG